MLTVLAAVLIAGTIANAAPHLVSSSGEDPTPTSSVSESESPSDSPSASESADPSDTPAPDPTESSSPGGDGVAPDFSACVGLTGLENAICRHQALLLLDPNNTGLLNSLDHLQANLAKHQAQSGVHGHSADAHGHSGDVHGNSGGPHGHSGDSHGHNPH
jgi:hypothetical protein